PYLDAAFPAYSAQTAVREPIPQLFPHTSARLLSSAGIPRKQSPASSSHFSGRARVRGEIPRERGLPSALRAAFAHRRSAGCGIRDFGGSARCRWFPLGRTAFARQEPRLLRSFELRTASQRLRPPLA